MAYTASHRFAHISPTKVRPIARLIRKKPVNKALESLTFLPNRGAKLLKKVLESAVANAEDRGARHLEQMVVVDARVEEGPRAKRIRPRARGMAFLIIKRMSHIRITIDAPG
jgi:large subunit ribosomal protein L22